MNEKQTSMDWRFWRRWVLYSTLGYGVGGVTGFLIALILALFFISPLYPSSLGWVMAPGGAIAGISIGLALWQAIRMKPHHFDNLTWTAVNMVGMAICWIIFLWIMNQDPMDYTTESYLVVAFLVAGSLWGLLSAAIQWHILQQQFQHTKIWFALNVLCGAFVPIIGLVISRFLIGILTDVNDYESEYTFLYIIILAFPIFWPIAGFLYGLVTGTVLTRLMREPNQPDELNEHVLAG